VPAGQKKGREIRVLLAWGESLVIGEWVGELVEHARHAGSVIYDKVTVYD
jgi:hypothetical protein